LAASRARAREDRRFEIDRDLLGSNGGLTGFLIHVEDVLEHHFAMIDIFAGLAVHDPENAALADLVEALLAIDIDEDMLERIVEIERLAGEILVIPEDFPIVGIERQR